MKIGRKLNQQGIAHLGVIVLAVVVLGVVGVAGYRVMNKDKSTGGANNTDLTKEIAAECKKAIDDKDLCKFFTSWEGVEKFSIESTTTAEGATVKSIIKVDGDNTYMKQEGDVNYEVISIGNSTYTKGGDTWWKQTVQASDDKPVNTDDFDFDEPDTDTPEASQTKYEKQGKEACGSRQCFKYKVVDPSNSGSTDFIWFDDKEFKLRRSLSESADGTKSDQAYAYDNISVAAPSPVKDLGPNQYIVPGQAEPMTLPNAADFQ